MPLDLAAPITVEGLRLGQEKDGTILNGKARRVEAKAVADGSTRGRVIVAMEEGIEVLGVAGPPTSRDVILRIRTHASRRIGSRYPKA